MNQNTYIHKILQNELSNHIVSKTSSNIDMFYHIAIKIIYRHSNNIIITIQQ